MSPRTQAGVPGGVVVFGGAAELEKVVEAMSSSISSSGKPRAPHKVEIIYIENKATGGFQLTRWAV